MYKTPKITNISCPICGQEYPGKARRTSSQDDECPLWKHVRDHHEYDWWGGEKTVTCACGVVMGPYNKGKDPYIARSVYMALIYDHFRMLEPHEVEEHIVLFAMMGMRRGDSNG